MALLGDSDHKYRLNCFHIYNLRRYENIHIFISQNYIQIDQYILGFLLLIFHIRLKGVLIANLDLKERGFRISWLIRF